jgi:hypothetical protein
MPRPGNRLIIAVSSDDTTRKKGQGRRGWRPQGRRGSNPLFCTNHLRTLAIRTSLGMPRRLVALTFGPPDKSFLTNRLQRAPGDPGGPAGHRRVPEAVAAAADDAVSPSGGGSDDARADAAGHGVIVNASCSDCLPCFLPTCSGRLSPAEPCWDAVRGSRPVRCHRRPTAERRSICRPRICPPARLPVPRSAGPVSSA